MFSAFGGIALLLAVIGVYGVKLYVVSRRTREFGIRIATGAHPRALVWQVLREGGGITAVGIGIGLLLALGAGQLLQGFLYGVDAVEPVVLVAAPLILLASSLLASSFRRFAPRGSIPPWRCDRSDPGASEDASLRRSERLYDKILRGMSALVSPAGLCGVISTRYSPAGTVESPSVICEWFWGSLTESPERPLSSRPRDSAAPPSPRVSLSRVVRAESNDNAIAS